MRRGSGPGDGAGVVGANLLVSQRRSWGHASEHQADEFQGREEMESETLLHL